MVLAGPGSGKTKTVPSNEGNSWKCAIHAKLYIYDFIEVLNHKM
jgi:hypothetical protein